MVEIMFPLEKSTGRNNAKRIHEHPYSTKRWISHNPVTSVLMTNHVHLLLSADSTAAPGH